MGAKRLGEEMVWGRNVPDSRHGGPENRIETITGHQFRIVAVGMDSSEKYRQQLNEAALVPRNKNDTCFSLT